MFSAEIIVSLTPYQALGIPIALVGAVFLSFGAQYQHRGVTKVEALRPEGTKGTLGLRQLLLLLQRPSWVIGTLMLGLAILLQLTSLKFAPLIVVQPLGVVALVLTAIINSRISKTPLNRRSIIAIVLCVVGVASFVTVAAIYAVETPVSNLQLIIILGILALVAITFALIFFLRGGTFNATSFIVGAGVLYGFVATLAKVVIVRIGQGDFDWLTFTCLVALLIAAAMGAYFVQAAYANGPPDLVIAGLTVIDPLVAVAIGIFVLGEATLAPVWAGFAFAIFGATAIVGVFQLAKHHPQSH